MVGMAMGAMACAAGVTAGPGPLACVTTVSVSHAKEC